MNYRALGKTGVKVSEVGIGGEYLEFEDAATVTAVMRRAMELGVNILDVFMSEPNVRTNLGNAISGRRDKILIQGHYGSIFENGQYAKSRDMEKCDRAFTDLLERLQTDYIDIGMIHYVDSMQDWEALCNNGFLEQFLKMKAAGKIHLTGFSSHNAVVAQEIVRSGHFDVMMFSINPTFDFVLDNEQMMSVMSGARELELQGTMNVDPERARLYALCEEKGVGITVMKGLGAGRLLDASLSPFRFAMTEIQCIHYALSRPATCSVLVGARSIREIERSIEYSDADDAQRDYSEIFKHMQNNRQGKCMYCNHCLPCPSFINIGAVTRLADEGKAGINAELQAQYRALGNMASACIECGACEKRCPFDVQIIENMRRAKALYESGDIK